MTEHNFPPFTPAALRVEASWPEGCEPESLVVEINDQTVTAELVSHVVMTLFTATNVKPDRIDAQLVGAEPALEGGTAR